MPVIDPLFFPHEGCTTVAFTASIRGTLSGTSKNEEYTRQFCCPSSLSLYRPGLALLKHRLVLTTLPDSSSHCCLTPFLTRIPQSEPLAIPHRAGVMVRPNTS